MRDTNRIEPMLEVIKNIWKQNPDLRLGQLFANLPMDINRLYFIEDEDLIALIKRFYEDK